MKNITVSVKNEVYRKARIKAAEMDTSVSALVAEYLVKLSMQEDEKERKRQLLWEAMEEAKGYVGKPAKREELYDR